MSAAVIERETFAGAQAEIRRMAVDAFAQHVLTEVGPGEWRCGKPDSGTYSFRVITRPGMIVIWGDLGEGVFCGAGDIVWLRRAVHSPEYLLEKWRTKTEDFYPGDAFAHIRDHLADEEPGSKWHERYRALQEAAERAHEWGELNQHTWADLALEHLQDFEACSVGTDYDSRGLWFVECLRWLVEHLPAEGGAA